MLQSMADKQGASAYAQYGQMVARAQGSQQDKLSYMEFRKYFFDEDFDINDLVKRTLEGEFK